MATYLINAVKLVDGKQVVCHLRITAVPAKTGELRIAFVEEVKEVG